MGVWGGLAKTPHRSNHIDGVSDQIKYPTLLTGCVVGLLAKSPHSSHHVLVSGVSDQN